MTDPRLLKCLANAVAMSPMAAVAMALGRIFSGSLSSVARVPEAREGTQQFGLPGFALTEAIALFTLIVVFMLLFVA